MLLQGKIPQSMVDEINKRLLDRYGRMENDPVFRVVWADDQREFRKTQYTDEGILLLHTEVRELRKYSHIREKYLLERITAVPEFVQTDLVYKKSYEPLWVFESKKGLPLVPKFEVCWHVIENVLHAMDHRGYVKYHDPELDPEEGEELKKARLRQIMEDLWGDETDVQSALHYGEGVVVPGRSE